MEKRYDIEVKVISQEGKCVLGHKVGDSWIIGPTTPAGLCSGAFNTIYPDLRVLSLGGEFPWSQDKDTAIVARADARSRGF